MTKPPVLYSVRLVCCNFDVSSTSFLFKDLLFQRNVTFTDCDDLVTERRSDFLQSLLSRFAVRDLA